MLLNVIILLLGKTRLNSTYCLHSTKTQQKEKWSWNDIMQIISTWVCWIFWSNSFPSTFARTAFADSHPLSSSGFEITRPKTCSASPFQKAPPRTAPSSSSCSPDHLPRKTAPSGLCPWDTPGLPTQPHPISHAVWRSEPPQNFLSKSSGGQWGFIENPGQPTAAIVCKARRTKRIHNPPASDAVLPVKN